jgi:hypothetical protein
VNTDPGTYILTESLSEFRIRPDGDIDRMSLSDTQFRPFVRGGVRERLIIGERLAGVDEHGRRWSTSRVVSVRCEH